MPRAFITGVTGQDGSFLSEQLVDAGWEVHGLIRAETAPDEQGLPLSVVPHVGSLADIGRLAQIIDDVEPDAVYNLAGVSSVAYSWDHPVETATVTGLAVTAILDAVWRLQERTGVPRRVLQASSSEIFGAAEQQPQDERTPLRPVTPYGAAKAFAHQQVQVYRARGLFASNAILYNHESPRRPPTFVTRKISLAAVAVARGDQDAIELGNLDSRRDWGWAPDFVDAMVRILSADRPDDFVVATGETHSVREFAHAALRAAGVADVEERVVSDPRFTRPNDAPEMRGDATRLREELGWSPTLGFDALVSKMVEHDLGATPS